MGPGQDNVDIIHLAKELGRYHIPEEEAAKIAALKLAKGQSHNSGWYRIQATRKLTGSHRVMPKVNDAFKDVSKHAILFEVYFANINVLIIFISYKR